MSSQLERAKWVLNSYITEKETKEVFHELFAKILEQNKDNVLAFIPVGNVDVVTRNISAMTYCEDYEVLSYNRIDDEGNVFESEEAYDEHIQSLADDKFGEWLIKSDYIGNEKKQFVFNENGDCEGDFDSVEGAEYFIQETKKDWMDEQTAYDNLDVEYHEVYWNTVWRFNNHMNRDVAVEVGLGVLEIYHEDNDEFLFLRGCGMDLSPQLMAYQALAHGYIDENYLKHFRDVEYTQYVLGNELFDKVVRKLRVKRFFQV